MSQASGTTVPQSEDASHPSDLGTSRPAQGPLNHDEFPNILCGYQTNQFFVALNRKHGALTILKPGKGRLQHVRRIDSLKIALHNLTNKRLFPLLRQGDKQPPSVTGKSCCAPASMSSTARASESFGESVRKSRTMARLTGIPPSAVLTWTKFDS